MHIVIDGYNLFKLSGLALTKHQFIAQLQKYAFLRKHQLHIVFDGGDTSWPQTSGQKGVAVIHAGAGRSADDYIKEMVQKMHADLFVSSDNELVDFVGHYGVPVIGSSFFWSFVLDCMGRSGSIPLQKGKSIVVKKHDTEWTEFDELMESAALASSAFYKKEEHFEDRCSKKHVLSKKEKAVERIIKKL